MVTDHTLLTSEQVKSIGASRWHSSLVYRLAATVNAVRTALKNSLSSEARNKSKVLCVLHRDGYVEIFCRDKTWIKVVHAIHTNSAPAEILAEELLRENLSRGHKDLYMPGLLRANGHTKECLTVDELWDSHYQKFLVTNLEKRDMSDLVKIGACWVKDGKDGKFFACKFEKAVAAGSSAFIFRNKYKKGDKQPDHEIFLPGDENEVREDQDEYGRGKPATLLQDPLVELKERETEDEW